jgi:hypothetical protein
MFTHVSHSYLVQVAALYCSFIPPLAIFAIIAGAWRERQRHSLLKGNHGSQRR